MKCSRCSKEIVVPAGPGGTGYATNANGDKICYACCADEDRQSMIANGHITLYLTQRGEQINMGCDAQGARNGYVSNWLGSIKFVILSGSIRVGQHNIAGKRYDVWFTGPDGYEWHGVQYGDNTQLCHCKRTKHKA